MTGLGTIAVVATLFTSLFPRVMVSSTDFSNSLTVSSAASAHYTLAVMSVVALIFVPLDPALPGLDVPRVPRPGRRPPRRADALDERFDVIALEVFGESALLERVASTLDHTDGVSHVACIDATRPGYCLVSARVRPRSVDALLDTLQGLGVAGRDVTLDRIEVVGALSQGRAERTMVWADVLGTAWVNARPLARYLAFMVVAGVIASYGVVDNNGILIVGAMAVSPDLLPITAIAVGIVGRQAELASRALLTLALGLAAAGLAAAATTFMQDHLGFIPAGYSIRATGVLTGLTTISNETVVVAFVAGVAGMLALETRASSGVGVAISVTTIPAVGYFGVAVGLRELDKALGALGVLGVNVLMMVVGAVGTLLLQRALLSRPRTHH